MVSLTGLSHFATDYINVYQRKDIKIDIQSIKTNILKLMVEIDIPVDPDGKDIENIDDYKKDKDEITYRQIHFKWQSMEKVTWVPNLQRSIRGYSLMIDAPHIEKLTLLLWVICLVFRNLLCNHSSYSFSRKEGKMRENARKASFSSSLRKGCEPLTYCNR
jgi:hypothetical protein